VAKKGKSAKGGKLVKKGGKKKTLERTVMSKTVRSTRRPGKKSIPEKLQAVMAPSEEDIKQMIAAKVHVGRKASHVNMKRYVWKKRRADGFLVINLQKTWYKLQLAARIIASVKNPEDVVVMSSRQFGQRGAIKFAHYTGATAHVSKWVPGTFCNPQNKAFLEPRLLLVDDPMTCFGALRETSYMGIPVIAFCGTENNLRFVTAPFHATIAAATVWD
jgi:small subunit ribosomal protein SAe